MDDKLSSYDIINSIRKYTINEENSIKENIELDTELTLNVCKSYVKELLDYIHIKFNYNYDFDEYEFLLDRISKATIELTLICYNTNYDIVQLLTDVIFDTMFEDELFTGREDKLFTNKELNIYINELYSDLEQILNILISENSVLKTLKIRFGNFVIVPIHWYMISLPSIYKNTKTVFETVKLKTHLIRRQNEQYSN